MVTLGSALIMLVSKDGLIFDGVRTGDPARLAAQVISGTIMKTGDSIKGLTTASSLWVSAGLGLAIGAGYYLGGIVAGFIALLTLLNLGHFQEAEDINYFKLVQNLSKTTNIRVTFLDMSGRPIADSLINSIIFNVDPYFMEFNNSYTGENSLVRRYSKEAGEKYFFLTTGPIELANDRLILRVGDTYNESDHVIEEVLNYFLISLIISMLLAIPFSYFLAGYIVGPIKELTKASKSIAGGDFNNKIKINSKDEIGELVLSFNQMGKDLDQRIKEINNTNRKINSILTSIQDGILALDLDGNVISVNDGVKKNLGISRDIVIGENIKKTFDSLDYMKNIKEDLMSTREYYIEVNINAE